MIIQCIRVSAAQGIRRLVRHLYDGEENENIQNVQGSPADVADMHEDARKRGRKYCVRHWIVSPAEPTTEHQLLQIVAELAKEFGFDTQNAVIVEHAKPRAAPDAFDLHWHVLVGEIDPNSGRVLSSSHDYARNELIARRAEFAFGHRLVPGAHTMAVIAELRNRGMEQQADHLSALAADEGDAPRAAFSHAQHQEAKREGIDLPALRVVVKEAWAGSTDGKGLLAILAEAGLSVQQGTRAGTWIIVDESGTLVGALDRLAGVRKAAVRERLDNPLPATHEKLQIKPADSEMPIQKAVAEIEAVLSRMEQDAKRRRCAIPKAPTDPASLIAARKADVARQAELAKIDDVQNKRAHNLASIERRPPRWWWLPSWRRKWAAQRQQALSACEAVEAAVNRLRHAALDTRLAVQRHENAIRDEHKRAVEQAVRQDHEAQQRLRLVSLARALLAIDPILATKGIDHLLHVAEKADDDREHVQALDF